VARQSYKEGIITMQPKRGKVDQKKKELIKGKKNYKLYKTYKGYRLEIDFPKKMDIYIKNTETGEIKDIIEILSDCLKEIEKKNNPCNVYTADDTEQQ